MRDATKYFLVIFTAHLILVVTIISARVGLVMDFVNRDDAKLLFSLLFNYFRACKS